VIRESPTTVRGPDIAYFLCDREFDRAEKWVRKPPFLVVEVVSNNETQPDLKAKIQDYLAMGVQYVWTVHPDDSLVLVYTRDGKPRSYDHAATITVPELPGFELTMADLFE
jgi:Uma2 family endonuclease